MATEARETAGLIGSDKVEGTAVYDAKGEHIGSIERVMIEKISGQVAYAVLSFGGFLGIGSDYYPIPWQSLKYDTQTRHPMVTTPVKSACNAVIAISLSR
jgi:PRC-barrel domain protein